jgi:hypothetical protein
VDENDLLLDGGHQTARGFCFACALTLQQIALKPNCHLSLLAIMLASAGFRDILGHTSIP